MPFGLVSIIRSVRCSASLRMYGTHICASAILRTTATACSRQVLYPQAPQFNWSSGACLPVRSKTRRICSSVTGSCRSGRTPKVAPRSAGRSEPDSCAAWPRTYRSSRLRRSWTGCVAGMAGPLMQPCSQNSASINSGSRASARLPRTSSTSSAPATLTTSGASAETRSEAVSRLPPTRGNDRAHPAGWRSKSLSSNWARSIPCSSNHSSNSVNVNAQSTRPSLLSSASAFLATHGPMNTTAASSPSVCLSLRACATIGETIGTRFLTRCGRYRST